MNLAKKIENFAVPNLWRILYHWLLKIRITGHFKRSIYTANFEEYLNRAKEQGAKNLQNKKKLKNLIPLQITI